MKVYAWLIDLVQRRKNCPTGMIFGWVQKVTEHRGTIQYILYVILTLECTIDVVRLKKHIPATQFRANGKADVIRVDKGLQRQT